MVIIIDRSVAIARVTIQVLKVKTKVQEWGGAQNIDKTNNLLLNFSTLNPTVGTISRCFCSSGLKWFRIVVFPELSNPTTRTLHSHLFKPRRFASLSKNPMILKSALPHPNTLMKINTDQNVLLTTAYVYVLSLLKILKFRYQHWNFNKNLKDLWFRKLCF